MPNKTTLDPKSFATFGQLLRFLRRRAGLTQEALGRAVGYTGAHIGRLEQNERAPDLDTLAARFTEALLLEAEPAFADRLLALGSAARGEPPPKHHSSQRRPPGSRPPLVSLTSFVGRERELAEAERLLGKTRLLTVVGAGGSGKTRLALELATRLEREFADGLWLVDLASLADPALVPQAVAAALGVPANARRDPTESVLGYLRSRQALLLLDNCEQVVGAVADLAEALLRGCPNVTLLATSREAVRAAGEGLYRLPPLSLPERHAATAVALAGSEAARLFVQRAQAAWPAFELTDANTPAVAEICRRVDGLPLAIELAAARVSALAVDELAARLGEHGGLRLLAGGRRGAHARQATLEALLDWSYVLLSDSERALLRQLAVLPGSWTLAAAEAVAAATDTAAREVVADLSGLVDKSLVGVEEERTPGERRYRLLEPIREFALARLEAAGGQAAARGRHLAYWAGWMEAATPRLDGPEQAGGLERIAAEHHHLRAALAWCLEPGADYETGLRLAVSVLGGYAVMRGHLREGLAWAHALLARAPTATGQPYRAKLLARASHLAMFRFEHELGLVWSRAASAQCRALDDRPSLADALWAEGVILASQEDYAAAQSVLEDCVAVSRGLDDAARESAALVSLGRVLDFRPPATGQPLIEEGLALANRQDNAWGRGRALLALANSFGGRADYQAACAVYERALPVAQQLGDPITHAAVLQSLAFTQHMLGDYPSSGRYAAEAGGMYRDLGDAVQQPFVLRMQGYAALHAGAWAEAQAFFAASLRGNRALGHRPGQAAAVVGLAALAEAHGDRPRALALAGCVAANVAAGELLAPDARALTELAGRLSAEAGWEAGRGLTLEQGVALALEEG